MSAIIDSNRSTRGIGDEGEEKKEDRDQRTQVYFSQRSVPIIVDLSVLFRNARMESLVNGIHALFFRLAQVQAILQPKC